MSKEDEDRCIVVCPLCGYRAMRGMAAHDCPSRHSVLDDIVKEELQRKEKKRHQLELLSLSGSICESCMNYRIACPEDETNCSKGHSYGFKESCLDYHKKKENENGNEQ